MCLLLHYGSNLVTVLIEWVVMGMIMIMMGEGGCEDAEPEPARRRRAARCARAFISLSRRLRDRSTMQMDSYISSILSVGITSTI